MRCRKLETFFEVLINIFPNKQPYSFREFTLLSTGNSKKELSFCYKLRFNSYNLATRFPKPLIFQTINSGRSNSLSLKYQRCSPSLTAFKEFERWFKFKPRLKYGWFHLKLYQMFQDLSRRLI